MGDIENRALEGLKRVPENYSQALEALEEVLAEVRLHKEWREDTKAGMKELFHILTDGRYRDEQNCGFIIYTMEWIVDEVRKLKEGSGKNDEISGVTT